MNAMLDCLPFGQYQQQPSFTYLYPICLVWTNQHFAFALHSYADDLLIWFYTLWEHEWSLRNGLALFGMPRIYAWHSKRLWLPPCTALFSSRIKFRPPTHFTDQRPYQNSFANFPQRLTSKNYLKVLVSLRNVVWLRSFLPQANQRN